MTRYDIQIASSAERQFRKLQSSLQQKIKAKILSLGVNPQPYGSQKLHAAEAYRIRLGDYRILYEISDSQKTVYICDIGHRRDIYRS